MRRKGHLRILCGTVAMLCLDRGLHMQSSSTADGMDQSCAFHNMQISKKKKGTSEKTVELSGWSTLMPATWKCSPHSENGLVDWEREVSTEIKQAELRKG